MLTVAGLLGSAYGGQSRHSGETPRAPGRDVPPGLIRLGSGASSRPDGSPLGLEGEIAGGAPGHGPGEPEWCEGDDH